MSKKYIANLTAATIIVQDDKKKTITKLDPYKCSMRSFDSEYLDMQDSVQIFINRKYIALSDERINIELKNAKDFGQKYKIGTEVFVWGPRNMKAKILAYNPHTFEYTVQLLLTNGLMKWKEEDLSLTEYVEQKPEKESKNEQEITADGDISNLNITLAAKPKDIDLSKALSQKKNVEKDPILDLIDVPVTKAKDNKAEDDSDTIITKTEGQQFASEVSLQKMTNDTSKVIDEKISKEMSDLESANTELEESVNEIDFSKIPETHKIWFNDFMGKVERSQKVSIANSKDKVALQIIVDNVTGPLSELAKSRIEKLNG